MRRHPGQRDEPASLRGEGFVAAYVGVNDLHGDLLQSLRCVDFLGGPAGLAKARAGLKCLRLSCPRQHRAPVVPQLAQLRLSAKCCEV